MWGSASSYLDGKPIHELETLEQGNGLGGMRVIIDRLEPRAAQPKRVGEDFLDVFRN